MTTPNLNNKVSDTLLTIGRNMKKFRTEKGLTQQELGYLSGNVERCTISNIETFKCSGMNITTLIKISIVLDKDIIEFFKS